MRLVLVLACLAVTAQGKYDVPFGNGWRFHFGDDPTGTGSGPNECVFQNVTGQSCTGMEFNVYRWTVHDCMMACCYNPECFAWQQNGDTCKHGTNATTCSGSGGEYQGGIRSSSPPFQRNYTFKDTAMDDSAWALVSAPHDYSINQTFFNNSEDKWHGYLPRNTSWYRKHFSVPAEWQYQTIYVVFEGVHQYSEIYVNGEWIMDHAAGYTEFTVRLDNITSLTYGNSSHNVIAIRTDGTFGSGHWYEGGGIYRDTHIVATNSTAHFTHKGVYVNPESNGSAILCSAEIESLNTTGSEGKVVPLTFVLSDAEGNKLFAAEAPSYTVTSEPTIISFLWSLPSALKVWSTRNPVTYRVQAYLGIEGQPWSDVEHFVTAFRTTKWGTKFSLNNVPMDLFGFSHHTSFAGVGVVSSPRINLFRVQTAKALGSNFWRCSHNPYEQHLYELLAHVGLVAWDENRDFGMEYTQEMADMIKMHRNHAPVVMWSFCNENSCSKTNQDTAKALKTIAETLDPLRPTTANMDPPGDIDLQYLDVVGFSHGNNQSFIDMHTANPSVPLLLGECCSCSSNRMAGREFKGCASGQNYPGTSLPFTAGSTGVWTLMDYFGESAKWPLVTSDFGQFDICGFPKSSAWWYRTNWLAKKSPTDPARPLVEPTSPIARVLNVWVDPLSQIYCVVSTPQASLYFNGVLQSTVSADESGYTVWQGPPANTTNITCVAVSEGKNQAAHTLLKPKAGKLSLQLIVDVPSPSTATGQKLFLDGKDTALLRAQVVDENGVVNSSVSGNVSFFVSGSVGRLVGVGGAPDSHLHVQGNVMEFYGGLVRAVVKVNIDCTSDNLHLAQYIDRDQGPLEYSTTCSSPLPDITVTAVSDSFGTASVTLSTSSDKSDHPFSVARANANLTGYTYATDIVS